MIVSHKHRFIFLKTRKTAGTSIEVALARIAGDDAIVTTLLPAEDGHEPRNFKAAEDPGPISRPARRRLVLEARRNPEACRRIAYYGHMPAWLVREKLGRDVWDSYFKFCFERNPWEKVVSMYSWRVRDLRRPPNFSEWLAANRKRAASDRGIYTIDGACAVDAIGRYECLATDLSRLLERAGVSFDGTLPQAKSGARRADALYLPEEAEEVGQRFSWEVETFGYSCPPELRRVDIEEYA